LGGRRHWPAHGRGRRSYNRAKCTEALCGHPRAQRVAAHVTL